MSSPSDLNNLTSHLDPSDYGNMDKPLDDGNWKSVTEERSKGKFKLKDPSPDTEKAPDKSKKWPKPKRLSTDLHSVKSMISTALEKKKVKMASLPKFQFQTALTDHFHPGTTKTTSKAIPGTAVLSKKTTPMSLKPQHESPNESTTINTMKINPTTTSTYEENITKKLNKINPKTNRSASNSPSRARATSSSPTPIEQKPRANVSTTAADQPAEESTPKEPPLTTTAAMVPIANKTTSDPTKVSNQTAGPIVNPKETPVNLSSTGANVTLGKEDAIKVNPTNQSSATHQTTSPTYQPKDSPKRAAKGGNRSTRNPSGLSFEISTFGAHKEGYEANSASIAKALGMKKPHPSSTGRKFLKPPPTGRVSSTNQNPYRKKTGESGRSHQTLDRAPIHMYGRGGGSLAPVGREPRRTEHGNHTGRSFLVSPAALVSTEEVSGNGSYSDAFTAMAYSHKQQFDQSDQPHFKPLDDVPTRKAPPAARPVVNVAGTARPAKVLGQEHDVDKEPTTLQHSELVVGTIIDLDRIGKSYASLPPQLDIESCTEEMSVRYQGNSAGQGKTPEDEYEQDEHQHSDLESANTPPFTEVSHYNNPNDTSSLGVNQSMETAEAVEEEADNLTGPLFEPADVPPSDSEFQQLGEDEFPEADQESMTTQPQTNFVPGSASQEDDDDDASSDSDELEAEAEREMICPNPMRAVFH
jgi:hypothetical protein